MLRIGVKVLGAVLLLAILAGGILLFMGSRNLAATFVVPAETVRVPTDSASLLQGERLTRVYGCRDCHGSDLSGTNFIEEMPFMDLPAPNLTPAGVGARMDPAHWERAIRHGVGSDGRPLVIMPSEAYHGMSNQDLGALVEYLESLPARSSSLVGRRIGPMGRLAAALDPDNLIMARVVDHQASHVETVAVEETAAYGAYLIRLCTGCHGPELAGGPVPGGQGMVASSLAPPTSAIAGWSRDDFFRAIRDGTRPDGSTLSVDMPWRAFGQMTDTELGALWLYLQELHPHE